MKRKYDLCFCIGDTCKGTLSLREAGLQFLSFPLDWCGGPRFVEKASHIRDGFAGFLDVANLEKLPVAKTSQTQLYRDRKLGYTIIHEFHTNVPFEKELPVVRARLDRRINRFLGLLDHAKSALVLWINIPGAPVETPETAREVRRILAERCPNTHFDVLMMSYREGIPVAEMSDEEKDGVRHLGFDYKNHRGSTEYWEADQNLISTWLASQYEMDDYRTDAEKAAWAKKAATEKFDRFKAKNWFEYVHTKIQYKLYRHLAKRMERKGLI